MANKVGEGAARILQGAPAVGGTKQAAKVQKDDATGAVIDNVALTGIATHDGQAIKTATRAAGVPDAEVKFRAAIRAFILNGADYQGAKKVFADSGVAAKEIAKIEAEESSTHFRMARDEFVRSADQFNDFSARVGPKPRPQALIRLETLKREARTSFDRAVRADTVLGGLDPQRGKDLADMEAALLIMGFPKDQVVISSRQRVQPVTK
jgi:hypothetical protein